MGLRDITYKLLESMFKPKTIFLILFIVILAFSLAAKAAGGGEANIDDNNINGNGTIDNPAVPAAEPDVQDEPEVLDPATVFDDALFIGDSRTEGLKMFSGIENADFFCAKSMSIDKVMDGKKVDVNGQQMSIHEVLASKDYKRIYICLGINELGWVSMDEFIAEYKSLIDEIKSVQDDAQIYVELLLPVTKEKSDSDSSVNNERIYWYNTNLVEMAEENGVKYLNPDQPLIDENGALKSEATSDGVHINKEYCKKWADYLAQITY